MKLEDSNLNDVERAAGEKWIAKHRAANPSHDQYDVEAVTAGYGYKMKVVCLGCGEREDVTDNAAHGGYPHR